MNLRLANIDDLPRLKDMYKNIVDKMNNNNISIWDETYPCEFFSNDILNSRLYLLTDNHEIVAAFVLSDSSDGESYMKWEKDNDKALYLERLGTNVNYSRQGIGGITIKHAIKLAKQDNAKYLRLFVVDINKPAINLYLKNGFKQVDGIYNQKMNDDVILREYGFEIEV